MTMDASDRRAPGATRIPFEALVEVSPSLGPSFEAQAIDVSDAGMHLRTAYLPEVGQPLLCRFDAGVAGEVSAQGEVLWREEGDRGGEFGLRFVDLDSQSAEAIGRIVGVQNNRTIAPAGTKVRLHIEGLGFPMKARVKDATRKQLTVGNELGFLQVGKELELEDAETGEKRPARIDRVEVEIDPASRVPRLVVGLRYGDEPESVPIDPIDVAPPKDTTPEPSVMDGEAEDDELGAPAEVRVEEDPEHDDVRAAAHDMKSSFAKNAAKVTPALLGFAKRARATAGVLWDKRKQLAQERGAAIKRTTAPPPGGGLHATGRKVVRATDLVKPAARGMDTKRKVVLGATAGLAVVLAYAAIHKSPKTQAVHEKPAASAATALAAQAPAPLALPQAPPQPQQPVAQPETPISPPEAEPARDEPSSHHHAHRVRVTPFGNGAVAHGNVLKLKMDGAIQKIDGASEPTGFSVSLPGVRAVEPAGPLASRDNRIASIKVSNNGAGSTLDVAFKDGVPSYLVRARGDMLEIVLAAPGRIGRHERERDRRSEKVASKHHHHSHRK